MDAVEFPYPVDVVVPKLTGPSEGFVRAGVIAKELEASESDRVSVLDGPSIEPCTSFLSEKGVYLELEDNLQGLAYAIKDSKLDSQDQVFDCEQCKLGSQPNKGHGENLYKLLHDRGKSGVLSIPKAEDVQLERKFGKFPRNGNACSRKTQDTIVDHGVNGIREMSHKLDICPPKCASVERTQLVRQKSNPNGRRSDKRSIKVPVRAKYDYFFVKAGMSSFGSAGGANNFFGLYGLKSDSHDATKLLDDPPLQELLGGDYKFPNLGKDKVRKTPNMKDDFMHFVRKACSIFQSKSIQTQNIAEIDSCSNKKMSSWLLTSVSVGASGNNGDKCKSYTIDLSLCNEDSYVKTEAPTNPLHLPICQPKDVLQHLALPPPKDLESLLLDAAKPGSSSKNATDSHSGKQISRRMCLPAFAWSHTFNGHSRTNSDAAKASTSRSNCHGRWLRVGKNTLSYLNSVGNYFRDLESLVYNQNLIPSVLKVVCSDHKSSTSVSTSLPGHELELLPSATCIKGPLFRLESGGKVNYTGNGCASFVTAEHCPRLLAAARTLYDIASTSMRQSPDEKISLGKKPSQKALKARKLKSTERTEEVYATSVSVFGSDKLARSINQIMPSKRPKLCSIDNKKGPGQFNCVRKEPLDWSTPRSSRSSPSKTVKDIIEDTRHSQVNILRQSCIRPPTVRLKVSDKVSSSGQKLRKLLSMSWNRGRE